LVVDADFRVNASGAGTPSGILHPADAAYAVDVGSVALGGVIAHDGFASVVDADFFIRAGGAARRDVRQLAFAFRADFACCAIALAAAAGGPRRPALVVDADFRVNATRATSSGVLLPAETVHANVVGSEAVGIALARDGLAFAPNADFAIVTSVTGATPRGVILRQLAFAFHAGFDC
jgi:hypothetical protein